MDRRRFFVVSLLSMSLLSLEFAWTRIFSAEFFYTFAFLILSIAIMGLGLGGLALRLCGFLNRDWVPVLALGATGLMTLAGPPLVFALGLDFSVLFASATMIGKFVVALCILGAAFFFGGVALAGIFKRHPKDIPNLYMADLVGAGIGVLLSIVAMNALGTQVAVVWSALPVLLATLIAARRWWRLWVAGLLVGTVVLSRSADDLLEAGREEPAPVIYKHWDAMAKVKAYSYGGELRRINVDNVSNTPVLHFDGDWDALATMFPNGVPWDIDVGYLIRRFENCRFLSLGCGGGWDVMQALEKGAAEIHAVEVNRHIVRMMRDGDPSGYVSDSSVVDSTGHIITMPEFGGRIFHDPRVRHVAEDARTYVRRHPNSFDVIFSLSSNTWAALGSGSFALAENYLFTTEAFRDYWNALTPNGFLSMEHQVYMPRLVSEVLNALASVGVEDPPAHIAVYNFPKLRRNVLLVSKMPLTDEIRNQAYGPLTAEFVDRRTLLYPAADSSASNLIQRIVKNGWRTEADSARTEISPCTDDRPFIAQMGRWRNLQRDRLQKVSNYAEFGGFPLTKLMIAIVLLVLALLVLPLNLAPYLRRSARLPPASWVYFFLIGVAFMAIEVVLIQRYTLFIGVSTYSIAVVLVTLLVAGGVGSRFSSHVSDRGAFLGIILWLALEILLFRRLTNAWAGLPLLPRILVSAVLVAPLGFFMGMPFPKGASRVGGLVDWGFAVNGAASVLGSTAVLVVAFTLGFTWALTFAGILYLAAAFLLSPETVPLRSGDGPVTPAGDAPSP